MDSTELRNSLKWYDVKLVLQFLEGQTYSTAYLNMIIPQGVHFILFLTPLLSVFLINCTES